MLCFCNLPPACFHVSFCYKRPQRTSKAKSKNFHIGFPSMPTPASASKPALSRACPRPPHRQSLRFREHAHAILSVTACAFNIVVNWFFFFNVVVFILFKVLCLIASNCFVIFLKYCRFFFCNDGNGLFFKTILLNPFNTTPLPIDRSWECSRSDQAARCVLAAI